MEARTHLHYGLGCFSTSLTHIGIRIQRNPHGILRGECIGKCQSAHMACRARHIE